MTATPAQFADHVRRLVLARPFVPFMIETTTGDRIDVCDGVRLAMNESAAYVLHPRRGLTRIPMTQIASVIEKHQ